MSNENTSIIKPGQNGAAAALERVGFGTKELERMPETQGSALAARAQAEVQARYIVALQRPRHIEGFRIKLLEHCKRPGFAKVAEYEKPVGGQKIKGPSIRFVETALQVFGNVLPEETITYDDDYKRVTMVKLTDLETNITYSGDVIVEKTVERRKPKDGDEILGSRINSYGDTVYKIRATEDDFANKIGAACSKKLRNLGVRILPADIVADAMDACRQTRMDKDAKDPAAARRELADAFAALRVMPDDLDAFLGHPFDQASPAEIEELRGAYVTVREGDAKWIELVEAQRVARGEVDESKNTAATAAKLHASIDKVRAKQQAQAQTPGQQQPPTQPAQQQQPGPKTQPPAKAADPKFHKVVDVKDAAAPGTTVIRNPQTSPQAQVAPASDAVDSNCSMCGVPIAIEPNANPATARCEACANE